MHHLPSPIQPGPLTRAAAEALTNALRDLYALLNGFNVAPPLTKRSDAGGLHLGLDPATASQLLAHYEATTGTGGGAITVVDLNQPGGAVEVTVSGASTLQFTDPNDDDPFSVSSPSAGVARVEFFPASLTQAGYVSLSNQSMGAGAKYFSDKVGIGTASPLANSALDVRGYTYVYLAGIISFGGGNSPTSEANGAILQYAKGVSPQISMTIASADYGSGKGGGFLVDGNNARFSFRHNGATTPKFSFYNDATSTYTDGITNTATLNKLTPGGSNGSLTITGGLITGYTPPT